MTNETIAQRAHNLNLRLSRKPKKIELQRMVEDLYAVEARNDDPDGELLDTFAILYSQFMPAAPVKPKTLTQWVAKAAAKPNDPRYYLRYVFADHEAGRLIATDGHRIHLIPLPDERFSRPGFYCPRTLAFLKDSDYVRFPKIDRIVPDQSECETAPADPAGWEVGVLDDGTAYYRTPFGALNKQYADTVLAKPGGFDRIFSRNDDNAPICFDGGTPGELAVVAQLRVD